LDFIINKPLPLVILVCGTIYFIIAVNQAMNKLNRNWAVFKRQCSEDATVSQFEGEPGAGKTLTISHASIADTENMIDELEDILLSYELMLPQYNFAVVRLMLDTFFLRVDEKQFKEIVKTRNTIFIDMFKLSFIFEQSIDYWYYLYYRGTPSVSTAPIIDPYFDSFSKICEMDSMKFLKKMDKYPYEPYLTITIPEADKGNFNSHDSKNQVSEDGTFIFMGIASQLFGRNGHIRFDAQDKDQIIKRIRGVSGGYYYLKRKKVCMPLMLQLIYIPFNLINNLINKVCKEYISTREKTEPVWTLRKKQPKYKRNDVTFFYQLFKYIACASNNIIAFFQKFQYFKIYADFSYNNEYKNAKEITYCLNVMDFEHKGEKIYNTILVKKFYDDLKIYKEYETGQRQGVNTLDNWTSLEPDIEEFGKTGQGCYYDVIKKQIENE
jgi:hypothetical protein